MISNRNRGGFSLIELVVTLAILGLVASSVLELFSNQLKTQVSQKRTSEAQEDVRLVLDIMLFDVRAAGFMFPAQVGIASVDGGTNAADMVCSSDSTFMPDSVLTDATSRFDPADLTADVAGGSSSVSLLATDFDIDGNGTGDFVVGSGVIIAGNANSHCARITAVGATSISFTPATPGGFSVLAADAVAAPAIVYELTGDQLKRNNLLIATRVEDVQIEFAVDANDNGQIDGGEFPIHDLNGTNPALVRGAEVSVITVTAQDDQLGVVSGRQALANRVAASANDSLRRRMMSATTAPRNML
jgi:prepilin-type N-terminal cleavage/methylation domain-containing protein